MYLKNLTMLGFKSFAEKTALNFQPGITAIVGPNGCGKSNVADAIRWVLGEQSAKALRGGEMADVIFNGTDRRKPLAMAEVSLTIGDVEEEQLKAAGVGLEFNELTITRRVFRDGGSEYFINRTACRLKDIQQLFMGTGVGRTSYSIMAQGNITQIISSKPDDRRLVFEEAAGITKFKAQKKETLRKLDHTEQNLLRVADLIREVKRQIGSLQRQAGKARRYKQVMTDLQLMESQLGRRNLEQLKGEIQEREERLEALREEAESCSRQVQVGEDEIGELRRVLSEVQGQIQQAQQQGQDLRSEMERHEGLVQFNDERLRELDRQNEQAVEEIRQGEERIAAAQGELERIGQELEASEGELGRQREEVESKKGDLQRVESELNGQQEELRRRQSEAFSNGQNLSRARNELNTLDLQQQGHVVRLEKLSAEKVQLEEEHGRLSSRLEEFTSSIATEQDVAEARRGTVEERQARLGEIQGKLGEVGRQLDGLLRAQAEKRSRMHVLEQLEADHEGYSAGALAVLKGAQHVLGSLADRIRVPDHFITAIETALGHHLQLVLTEHPQVAVEILNDLSANRKGRASIASLSLLRLRADAPSFACSETILEESDPCPNRLEDPKKESLAPGDRVPALSVVEADESIMPLLQGLLGRTCVVADLETATQAWKESQGRDFVTVSGEMLSRHGVFTGGSGNASGQTTSVLARKNQIRELEEGLEVLEGQVEESSREKGALQSELTSLQAGLQEAQSELRSSEMAVATSKAELNALQNNVRSLGQKLEAVAYEIESLEQQSGEGRLQREKLAAALHELEVKELQLQESLQASGQRLEELRRQRDGATSALHDWKVALSREEQQCAALKQQKGAVQRRVEELGQMLGRRRGEIDGFAGRRQQYEEEKEQSRQKMESLQHDRDQLNLRLSELVERKNGQEGEVTAREEQLKGGRRRQQEIQQQCSGLDVELAQKRMSADNLKQRISERYQLDLEEIKLECLRISVPSEGLPRVEVVEAEEAEREGLSTDWKLVSEQVATLQKKVDEMGPVNLVAIEEYEETEQRYEFLNSQHDDLVQAKQELLDVINRINEQTKVMFTEAFEKIRENFRGLFTEIFGGGKADLVLVNEGDVLESGIDIVARPPGKQLQSISLLSGGEQTMTAVALLFAIYQVKPSPFCVLDELDAPLDESNINRFIRVLKRFLEHSQFVIITHNKRTIGMATVLYGVTMEEHGVSKIVSVKFHKADEHTEHGASGNGKALVPPASGPADAEEDQAQSREQTFEVAIAD